MSVILHFKNSSKYRVIHICVAMSHSCTKPNIDILFKSPNFWGKMSEGEVKQNILNSSTIQKFICFLRFDPMEEKWSLTIGGKTGNDVLFSPICFCNFCYLERNNLFEVWIVFIPIFIIYHNLKNLTISFAEKEQSLESPWFVWSCCFDQNQLRKFNWRPRDSRNV